MNTKTLLTVATATTALMACGPTSSIEERASTQLTMAALQSAPVARMMATSPTIDVVAQNGVVSGTMTVTEAWVVAEEVELEKDDDIYPEDDEIEFYGPFAIDLLNATSYPSFPQVEVKAGRYEGIEVDLESLEAEDLPGMTDLPADTALELLGYSMVLKGTYTSAKDSTYQNVPFTLKYDDDESFEFGGFDATESFVISPTQLNRIVIQFVMSDWFNFSNVNTNEYNVSGIEQAIVADGNGGFEILLTATSHPDVMDVIEENIEASADFGKDDDDDGYVDDEDDDDDDDDD